MNRGTNRWFSSVVLRLGMLALAILSLLFLQGLVSF
jgi:hypothetical protein